MNAKEKFIEKVNKKYGDIYDFTNVEYINSKHYIYPYCKKHKKEFKTTGDHLLNSNQICDECRLEIQREQLKNDFVEKSQKVHNNEYTYEHTNYVNEKTEVLVTCKRHGDFLVKPFIHKYHTGKRGCCPKCESERKYKEYVEYSINNHKQVYDYSKLDLDNTREDGKVCIICKKHGEFWQSPHSHKGGNECPKCVSEAKKMKTNTFIELASSVHKGKYTYDKTNLENKDEKGRVTITCPIHSDFLMTPNNHLRGKGCPYCAGKYKTTESVIEEFKKIHGDKYDYTYVIYTKATNNVNIKCKKCGTIFSQTPNKHLNGEGCPNCKSSILEKETKQFLEDNHIEYHKEHKEKWLGLQRLDFYLPQFNIAIECQGTQHFAKRYATDEEFEKIKSNDLKKYNLCKQNGVKVLYYAKNSKYIPQKYIDKIYFNLNDLLTENIHKNS